MRLSIKAKQVAGVTSIVGLAVIVLSGLYLSSLARLTLEESRARAELLANAVYHRAREVVATSHEPYSALRDDSGLRSILESSVYSRNVTYAAVVDVNGVAIAHSDQKAVGEKMPAYPDLNALLQRGPVEQIRAIYATEGQTREIRQPLLMGPVEFGSIRIGVSMLLTRRDLDQALRPAIITALAALVAASVVATLLAHLLLRPIHVIRSGLTRLGQGEFGVMLNLPQQDEFGELGGFFNAASAQLSADRTQLAGQKANLESVVERLEDAVAVFTPDGELLFANPAMCAVLPPDPLARPVDDVLPPGHPYRAMVEQTLATGQARGPLSARVPDLRRDGLGPDPEVTTERLILTHLIEGPEGRLVGVMLVARNLDYLGQVQSTINYSRKLAALGRLSAGVAHEIKNPLNATIIHLELLKQQLTSAAAWQPHAVSATAGSRAHGDPGPGLPAGAADGHAAEEAPNGFDLSAAMDHLSVIAAAMRRLDEVVQGFLKFIRPEDLKLQPVPLSLLLDDLMPIVGAEAQKHHIDVRIECPIDLPDLRADPGMLEQAFLNLALNACQSMPDGGRLRIAAAPAPGRQVSIVFEDSGVGIKPEDLNRIFNLYFTTRDDGSGIGLSMVYRTVQLHDGEIEVQSVPGVGSTFRLLLPQA